MACDLSLDKWIVAAVLTAILVVAFPYWVVRVGRRVRGDSYWIPLSTRWLYVLGTSKLVSSIIGGVTLNAGTNVVPLLEVRAVWNVLKFVLGISDMAFAYIDVSPTPWRPSLMPVLILLMASATWVAVPLMGIFLWVVVGGLDDGSESSTYCLSSLSSPAVTFLVLEGLSLVVLPLIDFMGGGMSRIGKPMCAHDPLKSEHPRIAFGRVGRLPVNRLDELHEAADSSKRLSVIPLSPLHITDAFRFDTTSLEIARQRSRRKSLPAVPSSHHLGASALHLDHSSSPRRPHTAGILRSVSSRRANNSRSTRIIQWDDLGATVGTHDRTPSMQRLNLEIGTTESTGRATKPTPSDAVVPITPRPAN